MVAETDGERRETLSVALRRSLAGEVEILTVRSREQALIAINEGVDAVIANLYMPNVTGGKQIIEAASDKGAKIIVLTAGSPEDISRDLARRCLAVFCQWSVGAGEIADLLRRRYPSLRQA